MPASRNSLAVHNLHMVHMFTHGRKSHIIPLTVWVGAFMVIEPVRRTVAVNLNEAFSRLAPSLSSIHHDTSSTSP